MPKREVQHYPYQGKLVEILRKRGITQRELCNRIGISETVMSLKIGGYRRTSVTEAIAIARVIGMPVEEIFVTWGDGDEPR